jgi:streptomycin 3"-adenylyltransferase
VAHAPVPTSRDRRPGLAVNVPATKVVDGAGTDGDPDLVLCFAVCRRAGRAVLGPPPREVFAEPPRSLLLEATADELRWATGHSPLAYRVLTTCRVLRFLHDGALVSKIAAGVWARDRVPDPGLVDLALAAQRAEIPMPADPAALAAADRLLHDALDRVERITRSG